MMSCANMLCVCAFECFKTKELNTIHPVSQQLQLSSHVLNSANSVIIHFCWSGNEKPVALDIRNPAMPLCGYTHLLKFEQHRVFHVIYHLAQAAGPSVTVP